VGCSAAGLPGRARAGVRRPAAGHAAASGSDGRGRDGGEQRRGQPLRRRHPRVCRTVHLPECAPESALAHLLRPPLKQEKSSACLRCFVRLDASLQPSGRRWAATASCSRTEPARPPTPPATSGTTVRAPCFDPLSLSHQFANRHDTHAMASDV
jgi:hypothetical protein